MKHWTKLGSTCLHRGGGVQFVSPPPPPPVGFLMAVF